MPQKIEISSKTIIFTVLFLLFLSVVWQIRELIFSLFIAFIIAGALKPGVDYLEKRKIPRTLASFFIYLIFVLLIVGVFNLIIPPLVQEITHLFKNLPLIVKKAFPSAPISLFTNFFTQNLPSIANQAVDIIKTVFSNIIFVTSTLFFGFYFILDNHLIEKLLGNFFEDSEVSRIEYIINKGQKRMASWFWGEVILMLVIGTMSYIGLTIIGMKYVLALSVLAGLLEVIPSLGPITSAIPAFLIGFSYSPVLGGSTVILNVIIQQLENNLIVPFIMKKVIGLHPIVTLIALVIGGKIAGIMGVILAVPTTIFIETVLIEIQKRRK
jgi:predicted PurR-regulated permease PerM